jgi:hypothetical protein
MKRMILHVSLDFASLPDKELDNFAEQVDIHLYGNPAYTTPTVLHATFTAAKSDFTAKLAAAATGGQADTAAKNAARQVLMGLLRQLALYVQGACNNNLATLLSSGFQAASTERHKEALEKSVGLILKNGDSGQIIAKVKPVKNAKMYEGRASADGGTTWLPSVFTGDSQHIILGGLTPGVEYTIEVRSLGGSTGHSDWSDPSKHRSL